MTRHNRIAAWFRVVLAVGLAIIGMVLSSPLWMRLVQ